MAREGGSAPFQTITLGGKDPGTIQSSILANFQKHILTAEQDILSEGEKYSPHLLYCISV